MSKLELEIWKDPAAETNPAVEAPKVVRLRLVDSPSGRGVNVAAVDEGGAVVTWGYLVRINRDGTLHRQDYVSKGIGFMTDSDGRIDWS